jgi:ankyrin repeat protein
MIQNNKSIVATRDSNGYTALHWAALFNQEKVVELLVDSGADVDDSETTTGQTPLVSDMSIPVVNIGTNLITALGCDQG